MKRLSMHVFIGNINMLSSHAHFGCRPHWGHRGGWISQQSQGVSPAAFLSSQTTSSLPLNIIVLPLHGNSIHSALHAIIHSDTVLEIYGVDADCDLWSVKPVICLFRRFLSHSGSCSSKPRPPPQAMRRYEPPPPGTVSAEIAPNTTRLPDESWRALDESLSHFGQAATRCYLHSFDILFRRTNDWLSL